jgi:hypothetical protein
MSTNNAGSPSAGFGVWQAHSGGKFAFTFTTFDFSHGSPGVTVVVSGRGTVEGNSQHGTFKVTVGGTPVGGGTFDGTRMTV